MHRFSSAVILLDSDQFGLYILGSDGSRSCDETEVEGLASVFGICICAPVLW
jgi:hypothetical protein